MYMLRLFLLSPSLLATFAEARVKHCDLAMYSMYV